MNYPEHRYTVEEKSQAVALVRSGMGAARAAAELGFPERSVQRWVAEYREMSAKEGDPLLTADTYRIVQRSTELLEAGLEYMAEQGPETAFKSLFVLNAIRGTSIDKLMGANRESPSQSNHVYTIVLGNVNVRESPRTDAITDVTETIETEFTETNSPASDTTEP